MIFRGINTNYYNPQKVMPLKMDKFSKEHNIDRNKFIILHPGRLTNWKGQKIFIEAIKLLNEKNDVPTFEWGNSGSGSPDVIKSENGGLITVGDWAINVNDGDETDLQICNFQIISFTNPDLFEIDPEIVVVDGVGILSFAAHDTKNGSSEVTVFLQDDGGTERGGIDSTPPVNFTITITAVNNEAIVPAINAFIPSFDKSMRLSGAIAPIPPI